jgi:mannose-6-phosphate isomerase-like protein (cupin superfamily)
MRPLVVVHSSCLDGVGSDFRFGRSRRLPALPYATLSKRSSRSPGRFSFDPAEGQSAGPGGLSNPICLESECVVALPLGRDDAEVAGPASTVPAMSWPPKVGEMLPQAAQAIGVREKLATYTLDAEHEVAGPKARAFALILGITLKDIDHRGDMPPLHVHHRDDETFYVLQGDVDVFVGDRRETVNQASDQHPSRV